MLFGSSPATASWSRKRVCQLGKMRRGVVLLLSIQAATPSIGLHLGIPCHDITENRSCISEAAVRYWHAIVKRTTLYYSKKMSIVNAWRHPFLQEISVLTSSCLRVGQTLQNDFNRGGRETTAVRSLSQLHPFTELFLLCGNSSVLSRNLFRSLACGILVFRICSPSSSSSSFFFIFTLPYPAL